MENKELFNTIKTYQELIDFAKSQKRGLKKEETDGSWEIHHIKMRSLGGGNNSDNLIKLTCFEHVYAHYLLKIELQPGQGREEAAIAFQFIRDAYEKRYPDQSQDLSLFDLLEEISISRKEANEAKKEKRKKYLAEHPEAKQRISEKRKEYLAKHPEVLDKNRERFLKMWEDPEKRRLQAQKMTGERNPNKDPAMRKHQSEVRKGFRNYTNGIENIRAKECPEGFWIGRVKKGFRWYNNGIVEVSATSCPEGFVLGRLKPVFKPIGLKYFNNGIKNIRAKECPEGFVPGMIKRGSTGKHFYTDGSKTVLAESCPKGFSKGHLQKKVNHDFHSGKHWYTNGVENRIEFEQPEGFVPGITVKRKNEDV